MCLRYVNHKITKFYLQKKKYIIHFKNTQISILFTYLHTNTPKFTHI